MAQKHSHAAFRSLVPELFREMRRNPRSPQ